MKLYICGSSKFLRQIEELRKKFKREDIECLVSERRDGRGICGCLEKIDRSDMVYVVDPGGYVGRSVSVDIGYAYARGKPIYATKPIDDPPVMDLLAGVSSHRKLIEMIKRDQASRGKAQVKHRSVRL